MSKIRQHNLNGFSLVELESAGNSIVSELVKRVHEEQDAKERALKAYDKIAEASDIWVTQVKVLREVCDAAVTTLRGLLSDNVFASELKHFDVAVIKTVYDGLFEGLERAKALEE